MTKQLNKQSEIKLLSSASASPSSSCSSSFPVFWGGAALERIDEICSSEIVSAVMTGVVVVVVSCLSVGK
jgi:hypothetical protein